MAVIGRGLAFAAILALVVGPIDTSPAAEPHKQVVEMKLQTGEQKTRDGIRGLFYRQQQWLYPSYKPRETLRREPEYKSAKPIYFAARYGDGARTEIVSAESLTGTLTAAKLARSVILHSKRQTLDLDFAQGPARVMPGTGDSLPSSRGWEFRLTPGEISRVPHRVTLKRTSQANDGKGMPGTCVHGEEGRPTQSA